MSTKPMREDAFETARMRPGVTVTHPEIQNQLLLVKDWTIEDNVQWCTVTWLDGDEKKERKVPCQELCLHQ
jgi:hypothetical protein